jgi:hypothetical protein
MQGQLLCWGAGCAHGISSGVMSMRTDRRRCENGFACGLQRRDVKNQTLKTGEKLCSFNQSNKELNPRILRNNDQRKSNLDQTKKPSEEEPTEGAGAQSEAGRSTRVHRTRTQEITSTLTNPCDSDTLAKLPRNLHETKKHGQHLESMKRRGKK